MSVRKTKKGGPEALVQGKVGRCPIREALRTTSGRKARNTLLQTIQACKQKNPCNCGRAYFRTKEREDLGEEEAGTTSGEAEES